MLIADDMSAFREPKWNRRCGIRVCVERQIALCAMNGLPEVETCVRNVGHGFLKMGF